MGIPFDVANFFETLHNGLKGSFEPEYTGILPGFWSPWPFIVLVGAFRFVCANGLVVGDKYLYLRKRHVYDFEQMNIKEQVSTALKRFNLQTNQWKKWIEIKLTEKTYAKVMKTMKFGKEAVEEIENRTDQEVKSYTDNRFPIMNLWIFYNILTWYITHRAVSLNHRVEMERRLRSAMRHFKRAKLWNAVYEAIF